MKLALKLLLITTFIAPALELKAQTYSLETLQQPYKYLVNPKVISKRDTAWFITKNQKFALGETWKAFQTAKYDSFAFDNKGYLVFDNKVDSFTTQVVMFFMSGNTANFTDKGT